MVVFYVSKPRISNKMEQVIAFKKHLIITGEKRVNVPLLRYIIFQEYPVFENETYYIILAQ